MEASCKNCEFTTTKRFLIQLQHLRSHNIAGCELSARSDLSFGRYRLPQLSVLRSVCPELDFLMRFSVSRSLSSSHKVAHTQERDIGVTASERACGVRWASFCTYLERQNRATRALTINGWVAPCQFSPRYLSILRPLLRSHILMRTLVKVHWEPARQTVPVEINKWGSRSEPKSWTAFIYNL